MVTSSSLGESGRQMHCPKCFEVWHVNAVGEPCDPPAPQIQAPEIEAPALTNAARGKRLAPTVLGVLSARRARPSRAKSSGGIDGIRPARSPLRIPQPGWAACVFLLLLASSGLLYGRLAIVRAVPQMASFYAMIGMPVNLLGLDLRNVISRVLEGSPQPVLAVQGEIANRRGEATPVPPLRLSVRDGDGAELYTWATPAPKDSLAAGETVSFRARLVAPPAGAVSLLVRFVDTPPPAAPVIAPLLKSKDKQ